MGQSGVHFNVLALAFMSFEWPFAEKLRNFHSFNREIYTEW